MNDTLETRYVPSSVIRSFSNGALHNGKDLYLNRKVLLYTIKGQSAQSVEEYVKKLSKISSFKHDGFHHILDTAFGEHSVLIIQETKPGKLLLEEFQQKNWTFSEAVSLVTSLGISMLDAMEQQITGFSTGAENIWVAADGRLSILNYWDEGEPQNQGAVGLCGLLVQMLSGAAVSPGPYEAHHTYLEKIPSSSKDQQDGLVKLFKLVGQGQASLSALVFGLQRLPPAAYKTDEDQGPSAIQKEHTPSRFYKFVGAGVFTIVLLGFTIWFLSSSSFLNPDETTLTSKDKVKPTVNATNTPVPQIQSNVTDVPSNPQQNDVTTPTLVGLTKAEAEKQALSSGLHYNYFIEPNGQAQGAVFKQVPQPGANISKGANVTFWIGK